MNLFSKITWSGQAKEARAALTPKQQYRDILEKKSKADEPGESLVRAHNRRERRLEPRRMKREQAKWRRRAYRRGRAEKVKQTELVRAFEATIGVPAIDLALALLEKQHGELVAAMKKKDQAVVDERLVSHGHSLATPSRFFPDSYPEFTRTGATHEEIVEILGLEWDVGFGVNWDVEALDEAITLHYGVMEDVA